VKPKLDLLERHQVQLGDGPLREQFDYQRNLFLTLDDDKLLKPFMAIGEEVYQVYTLVT
jgi:hypothetical protein